MCGYGSPWSEGPDDYRWYDGAGRIVTDAKDDDVAFLVVSDSLCATTHSDLIVRAKEVDIKVEVIHNASVMSVVGICVLQLYSFGQTVSVPFFRDEWRLDSFYDKIYYNRRGGVYTRSVCWTSR